ncbi:mucin-2 isoform X3 [Toxorhynchites rutilus septentrionalis]|uniref:mucin-2 isoform X3 n=1 Tax=Toxorhynchites rutilus septentrionalis TaxID=329112 RepID=UPI00247A245D|nr:mucin-2 isoform X3 [Toxorhynchites rutilus septentrionalis]
MAAPNADVMRGGGSSAVAPGSAIQQIAHHKLPPNFLHQQHSIPNHHIQQLQTLTQQTAATLAAAHHHPHNAIHNNHRMQQQHQHQLSTQGQPLQQQGQQQQLLPQQQQTHSSVPHKISQYSGSINNLIFPSTENPSNANSETRLTSSNSSSSSSTSVRVNDVNNIVVNLASVNKSLNICTNESIATLPNSSSNPVMNRITTNVSHIAAENSTQPNETISTKASGSSSSVARCNVAPGWRRIKYNCEIIYISPSGVPLRNFNQVKEYLLSGGTCKCGLPCPFRPEALFEFDSQVPNSLLTTNSTIPHSFCLHHTRYVEKAGIVRRGKKTVDAENVGGIIKTDTNAGVVTSQDNAVYPPYVSTSMHDANMPILSQKNVRNELVNSSPTPTNVLNHEMLVGHHLHLQVDKEITSIPLSKTPPWRKNTSSSSPLGSNSATQRQVPSSTNSVPVKAFVQNINQNEQLVKNSRNSSKSPTQVGWPEECSRIPKSTAKKRPNFKDDPTGYLNQQTAILHSSISTLHSPDGSSSSQESPQIKSISSYDSGENEESLETTKIKVDKGMVAMDHNNTAARGGGQTVTNVANGIVQMQQNCDISHMEIQQQLQFQQQLQRQNQLVRQHNEQLQILQQQQCVAEGESKPNTCCTAVAHASPVLSGGSGFTTNQTPDITSTSSNTPDFTCHVQGGVTSSSTRSPLFTGNIAVIRSESPEVHSNRNLAQSAIGPNWTKNQVVATSSVGYAGSTSIPRNTITSVQAGSKPTTVTSTTVNRITKHIAREVGNEDESTVVKTEKIFIQSSAGSQNVLNYAQQQSQQNHMINHPQQVLMTSSGQFILMSNQTNKHSAQVVVNSSNAGPAMATNVIMSPQSVMAGNNTQYMSIAGAAGCTVSSGNPISTVTTNSSANNSGIMQNIAHQQPGIIHHSQSNTNSNFLINSPNNMQSTVILNNGNVIQPGGQQILTANNTQVIHSANVLAAASPGASIGTKLIQNGGSTGLISNQTGINQLLNSNSAGAAIQTNTNNVIPQQAGTTVVLNNLPSNSIVIQPNYNTVTDGGHIVNQVVNHDGTTTSYIHQQNQQRHILLSPDTKRKMQTQLTASQQHQSSIQQQTLQSINHQGTMLQIAPQYPAQSFQLNSGISGLTIVPNKNSQQPQQQQQQILLQNGQIITQPYNIISQQVLLPAGLVMTPDATLVQIQNLATPCGSILTTPQGMVIRAQSPHQQKGFLSSNTGQQFIVNNSSQVSPMGAQIYGGSVNIVVPQQQTGATASFVQQNATIVQQQPQHILQSPMQVTATLNTSTDSCSTASSTNESPSLPTTPQPSIQHKSYLSGAASPPDTTTHSPNSPDCASSEKSAGSADSMNMAMVQCVSSSEPDLVSPTITEEGQMPSETTEYFEQGGVSPYQRTTFTPSEAKIKRLQAPTHQQTPFVRSAAGDSNSTGNSGNISISLPQAGGGTLHQNQIAHHQQQSRYHHQNHAPMLSSPAHSVQPDSRDSTTQVCANQAASSNQSALVSPSATNSTVPSRSFNVGELVWGAVRGFPAWPGKVIESPQDGSITPIDCVWVRWFGGRPNTEMVAVIGLKTLSEGLEAHHRAQKDARKGRRLNSQLERAIQEAMMELDRVSGTPSPSSSAVNTTNPALSSKAVPILASPTSSTKLPSISNITVSPTGRSAKTVRGQKSKLVRIAPAPPTSSEWHTTSTNINNSNNTATIVNRIKMK